MLVHSVLDTLVFPFRNSAPATWILDIFAPLRSTVVSYPRRSKFIPNVESERASVRRSDPGPASAPVRKWTSSMRLVFPARFLVCLLVAPSDFRSEEHTSELQ